MRRQPRKHEKGSMRRSEGRESPPRETGETAGECGPTTISRGWLSERARARALGLSDFSNWGRRRRQLAQLPRGKANFGGNLALPKFDI